MISWGCSKYEDNPKGWHSAFRECTDVLNENNVKYFLYGGALLGLIRDGDFIPWDTDIDIVVVGESDQLHAAIEQMLLTGWETGKRGLVQTYDKRPLYMETKIHIKGQRLYWLYKYGCRVDIIIWQRDGDYLYEYTDDIHKFPYEMFRELVWRRAWGSKFPIPRKYEETLEYLYGNWHIPETAGYFVRGRRD